MLASDYKMGPEGFEPPSSRSLLLMLKSIALKSLALFAG